MPLQRPAVTAVPQVEVLQLPSLAAVDWLLHGFSTRAGGQSTAYSGSASAGELNLGFTASDDRANVIANRERFVEAVTGNPQFPVVTLAQVHSAIVQRVDEPRTASDSGFAKADGMITDHPRILLAIQTADCISVLVADRKRRAVAGFHAGWRGTVKRIVEHGVAQMRLEFGSDPGDLLAAIGPGIGQCCYEVGQEVRDEFESQFAYAAGLFRDGATAPKKLHLDLVEANRRQLLDAGVKADTISLAQECTSCQTDRYFSYRAEGGFTGRMFSAIGIRPE